MKVFLLLCLILTVALACGPQQGGGPPPGMAPGGGVPGGGRKRSAMQSDGLTMNAEKEGRKVEQYLYRLQRGMKTGIAKDI
ncbi:hypothetical protein AB6A40_008280 [Gnathostoma spinigerum]|uniref:Uncharacterized protein n=1 Tax=Gnathostoma spinigerum TaxID=75299 RepID=A0ABD6EQJ5_9BILA